MTTTLSTLATLLLPSPTNAVESNISLSLSSSTINLDIPPAGGEVKTSHTITTSGTLAYGYNLTLSSTTNNTNLDHTNPNAGGDGGNNTIPTITTPGLLTTNTWGYSLDNTTYNPIKPSSEPAIIKDLDTAVPNNTDTLTINYGVRLDNVTTKSSGDYSQRLQYTATAKLPPAPIVSQVIPREYTIGTGSKRITIKGNYLSGTQSVVFTRENDPSKTEVRCADIIVASDTEVSCSFSADKAGSYKMELATPDGVVIKSAAMNVIYSVFEQSGLCESGNDSSDCIVDVDTNMIPIKYTGSSSHPEWTSLTFDETYWQEDVWYNYNEKRWANAVTVKPESLSKYQNKSVIIDNNDVLGYWVYIPRYAYEVQRPNATDKYVTAQNFDIRFEKATDTKKTPAPGCSTLSGSTLTAKDYRTQCGIDRTYPGNDTTKANKTTWATHPAFTWKNSTGSINKELNGIWVGKFETTGTKSKPTIKPNQHANISEAIGEFYNAARFMGVYDPNNTAGGADNDDTTLNIMINPHNMSNTRTHMLKNSEWGAIAYLSASEYGAGVNNVRINSAMPTTSADADGTSSSYGITGCGPGGTAASPSTGTYTDGTPLNATTIESETACSKSTDRSYTSEIGQLASTTNNIYGIYDMSGGTYEYVMGNRTTSANQTTSDTNYFKTPTSEPYVDLYRTVKAGGLFGQPAEWSVEGWYESYYAPDLCTWLTCGGHAIHEIRTAQEASGFNQLWGDQGGYAYMFDDFSTHLSRGGDSDMGYSNSIFNTMSNSGNADTRWSYRVAALVGV